MGGGQRGLQCLARDCSGVLQRLQALQRRRLAARDAAVTLRLEGELYLLWHLETVYIVLVELRVKCFSYLNLEGWRVGPARPGEEGGGRGLACDGSRREAHLGTRLRLDGEHSGLRLDGGHGVHLDLGGSGITGVYLESKIEMKTSELLF